MGRLQEVQVARVPWNNRLLEPSEDRVECHCKKKAARRTALSYTSGHKELSPSCSRELHVRGAVVMNTSQEAADKIRQFCLLNHGEDPGQQSPSIGCLISAERTQHAPERWSQSQRCCPSSAWKRYISAKDVCISWCSNGGLDRWQK